MSGLGRTHAISLTPHGADGTAAYLLADVADVDHDGVLTAVKVRLLPDALVEVMLTSLSLTLIVLVVLNHLQK